MQVNTPESHQVCEPSSAELKAELTPVKGSSSTREAPLEALTVVQEP